MSLRPINPPKITLDDLLPGDILLSAGSNALDRFIMDIDQGDYSHTSQYMGKIDGTHMVVEATTNGIVYESIGPDMTQDLVDAYRYVSPDGHHFGDPGWPVEPVLDVSKSFIGGQYAYSELLLAAVAIIASEIPKDPTQSIFTRLALDQFEHDLVEWLNRNANKTPMTCVQVATAAHWNATSNPANKYGLQVTLDSSRKRLTPSTALMQSDALIPYQEVRSRVISKMKSFYPANREMLSQTSSLTIFAGSDLLPLGSCTPRDMETSPTLKFIGCVKDTRKS